MEQIKSTETPAASPAHPDSRRRRPAAWIVLGLIVGLVVLLRVRLLDVPLERDEGEYGYVGQLILQGEPPYARAYTMKFPGVHHAYALILAAFGQTASGIHLGLLVINGASVVLLFLLGALLFDDLTGLCAAGTFGLLSLSQAVQGFSANAEHFVVLPMLGGVLLLLWAVERGRRWPLPGSGLLLGLSVLMKQHALAFVAFAVLFLLARGRTSWRRALLGCLLLAGGAVLPLAGLALYLWARGVFEPFWFWTFDYARHYGTMVPFSQGMRVLREEATRIAGSAVPLWALALVGATALLWDAPARGRALFLGLFSAFSFLAVCPGLLFRSHYFLLVVPAASLLAGVGARALGRLWSPSLPARAGAVIGLAAAALAVLLQRQYLFLDSPREVARAVYGPNPFPEAVEVGNYIRANSAPGDRVAVIGSEPEIYFYAGRQAVTGFLYTYPLMEPHPFALRMQQDMIAQVEQGRPRFLVVVNVDPSWLRRPDSPDLLFDWTTRYTEAHYRLVGVANILSAQTTAYRWGEAARAYEPVPPFYVLLFERAAGP